MLDLELHHADDVSIVRMIGGLTGEHALGRAVEAVVGVPFERHLVVDMSGLYALDDHAAMAIAEGVLRRTAAASGETVIVAPHEDVAVRLVIHDVDRMAPMVHTSAQALDIVRVRAGQVVGLG